jgi:glycosyltransferase involved in cell wall biosynthesis
MDGQARSAAYFPAFSSRPLPHEHAPQVLPDSREPVITQEPKTVALVYASLSHYRSGIFSKLLNSTKYKYIFVAGHNNLDPSIPEWVVPDPSRFVEAKCHPIRMPWYYQAGLAKLAVRKDISAIIYSGTVYSISTWYSAVLARLTGKKVLFWTHGWIRTGGRLREAIKKRYMRLADVLMLYGQRAKSMGERMGFSQDRMLVIYNSLDYDKQKKIREELRDQELVQLRTQMFGSSDTPIAICTTRLTSNCRLDLLLLAQAILRRSDKCINILLVGDGTERERLMDFAKSEALPVRFLGACYDEASIAKLIRAANVTVSPGKVGLTAIHSLAYGTPVISHDDASRQMPEVEAIIPGENGDLFRYGDANDLARVLWKWCSRPWPDQALRKRCYEVVERYYNPDVQLEIIESALSL